MRSRAWYEKQRQRADIGPRARIDKTRAWYIFRNGDARLREVAMHSLSCPAFEPLRLERFSRVFASVIAARWWCGANGNANDIDNDSRGERERFGEREGSASTNEGRRSQR
jgi:hypothetical protein